MPDPLLDSPDSIYTLRTTAAGPAGTLPLDANQLRHMASGDLFGLTVFGVNLTTLKPGAMSALRHAHTKQDEFVYILEGTPVLITDEGETPLKPGMVDLPARQWSQFGGEEGVWRILDVLQRAGAPATVFAING